MNAVTDEDLQLIDDGVHILDKTFVDFVLSNKLCEYHVKPMVIETCAVLIDRWLQADMAKSPDAMAKMPYDSVPETKQYIFDRITKFLEYYENVRTPKH